MAHISVTCYKVIRAPFPNCHVGKKVRALPPDEAQSRVQNHPGHLALQRRDLAQLRRNRNRALCRQIINVFFSREGLPEPTHKPNSYPQARLSLLGWLSPGARGWDGPLAHREPDRKRTNFPWSHCQRGVLHAWPTQQRMVGRLRQLLRIRAQVLRLQSSPL